MWRPAISCSSFYADLGVIPALRKKVDRTVLGQLTRDYERFLSSQRGFAPATLSNYLPIVRRFLTERFRKSTAP